MNSPNDDLPSPPRQIARNIDQELEIISQDDDLFSELLQSVLLEPILDSLDIDQITDTSSNNRTSPLSHHAFNNIPSLSPPPLITRQDTEHHNTSNRTQELEITSPFYLELLQSALLSPRSEAPIVGENTNAALDQVEDSSSH